MTDPVRTVTTYPNLATAVGLQLDDKGRGARGEITRYTPDQWAAINRLHEVFGLEVKDTVAVALTAGHPLLAVVRAPDSRRDHLGRIEVDVIEVHTPNVSPTSDPIRPEHVTPE